MVEIKQINKNYLNEVILIHKEAFKDHLNVHLGDLYLKTFFEWFIVNGEINLIVKNENDICGYIVGAEYGYQKKMNQDILVKALFSILLSPKVFFLKGFWVNVYKRIKVFFLKPPQSKDLISSKRIISLVGIGIKSKFHGTGVSSKIFDEFELLSKKSDFDVIRLSVYESNIRAIKFYKKKGFEITSKNNNLIIFKKNISSDTN